MTLAKNKKITPKIKGKKTAKTRRAKKAASEIKILVVKNDYLSHQFSPYVVDLKEAAPSFLAAPILPWDQPTDDNYFTVTVPTVDLFKKASAPKVFQPVEVIDNSLAIEALRQEILLLKNAVEDIEDYETAIASKLAENNFESSQLASVIFEVKKVGKKPWELTKQVVILFDSGINRLALPLRQLPLSNRSKALLGFIIVSLMLVLPIGGLDYYKKLRGAKNGVMNFAQAAAVDLASAGTAAKSEDWAGANQNFNAAFNKFSSAQNELKNINLVVLALAKLLPQTDATVSSAQALVKIGQNVAAVGQDLTGAFDSLQSQDKNLVEKISGLSEGLEKAAPLVAEINSLFSQVDLAQLPEDKRATFVQLKAKLPIMAKSFNQFVELANFSQEILGKKELKRYLVVFQNNHEIRPSGGFIGSYALLDLVNGEIKNLELPGGGSYDLQGSLQASVAAPQPLRLLRAKWEFQDGNWFSDWPSAAEKLIWFYNQSGGPTVDGVIAINSDLMKDLLTIIGPVSTGEQKITAANFYQEIQQEVEVNYDKEKNQPKEILGQLAPEVIDKMLTADQADLLQIISLLNTSLSNKNFQLYFTKVDLERQLADLGWQNSVKETSGDYLLAVNANVGGQKTDAVMKQKILHQAKIAVDGTVIDKVIISREHQGIKGDLFYGVRNVNYLRVYVPAGSKLLSASGFDEPPADLFEVSSDDLGQDADLLKISGLTATDKKTGVKINQEFNKTVFGGWTQTDPGKTSVITLEYELPMKISFAKFKTPIAWLNQLEEKLNLAEATTNYSLLVQKQSGVSSEFYSLVDLPVNWQKIWQYPSALKVASGSLSYGSQLDRDQIYGVLFKMQE